jgi:hypothetical protein
LIYTLLITILVEGVVVLAYSLWRKKSVPSLLITSLSANLITQLFLWLLLNLFFQHYLIALFGAEILIWIMESVFLYSISANRLCFTDAQLLSLSMNLASFVLGWFLPV